MRVALVMAFLVSFSGAADALLPHKTTGNLFVSMWESDEIAVFTPMGEEVGRFSTPGLNGPRGIAFNPANNNIWVAGEFSNALFIFDSQQNFLRKIEHQDFNEPVGISFTQVEGLDPTDQEVYVSNSNGNEIMVFAQDGSFIRRFTEPTMKDPNCTAFMADGALYVANRLGGSGGAIGVVSGFDANDEFQFDFTTVGIASLMAVARDPNLSPSDDDDTVWITSGGGATGIYEFDKSGNLLKSLLPADIDGGTQIIPQGIAFDDQGDFFVVSMRNEVFKFDGEGQFLMRFPTGAGTSRSTAFQNCKDCVEPTAINSPAVTVENTVSTTEGTASSSGGGGGFGIFCMAMLCIFHANRRKIQIL